MNGIDRSPAGPRTMTMRVQGRKCHRQVGGIGRHTVIGPSEDRVIAIDAVERRAAGARPSLVAGRIILVAEIRAARSLHDVAAHRGHVSELSRCGEQQSLGDDRKAPAYLRVRGYIAHPSQCADAQATLRQRFDPRHVRQPVDVQQTIGQRRAIFDQTDQVGTAGDERELRVLGVGGDRSAAGSSVLESAKGCMVQLLPAASATASTMLG